jgi:PAS domain-containing protein
MLSSPALQPLESFRSAFYACLGARRDALFELADAALTLNPASSLVQLSLAPRHRRSWGSLYDALAVGHVDVAALRRLLAQSLPDLDPSVYAIDTSVWSRCDAETSPERGYYYHASRHSAGQPIVAGWSYQWLAHVSFQRDSWTAPLDVRRVHPEDNVHAVAAQQIRQVLASRPAGASPPVFAFDAGYDPEQLAREVDGLPVAVLVRLRRGRCFYADPATQPAVGRHRSHGVKFACADAATWPTPSDEWEESDGQYGQVRVRAWRGLHARTQNHPRRGSRQTKPVVRGTVILVEVERVPQHTRAPQPLWLWWRGPGTADLRLVWRAYVHRFDLEHTFRFFKQTLHWTTPRVRHPEQADRWTLLLLAGYTQLRLAQPLVTDQRLPWERPLPAWRLTPCRVRRALSALLPALDNPARPPKPCGRSPGRPKGRRSGPAPRHPAIKKTA